jgi:hypothetical protein
LKNDIVVFHGLFNKNKWSRKNSINSRVLFSKLSEGTMNFTNRLLYSLLNQGRKLFGSHGASPVSRVELKIIMTLLVRNEEDIIRENIEFHMSQGVSFFIVTDNLSIDGTVEILKEYEDRGVLRYFYEPSDRFDQQGWVTRMARLAFSEYGADWVINNDADEFWWPVSGNLSDTFAKVLHQTNVLEAERANFVTVKSPERYFYKKMIYREQTSLNSLGRPLPGKVAHRGSTCVVVEPGNHDVLGIGEVKRQHGLIEVFHFPMRSKGLFENKIKLGTEGVERNDMLLKGHYSTWRMLYFDYQSKGRLSEYCDQNTYDRKRIEEEISQGVIVEDTRLLDYLSKLPGLQKLQ